MRFDSSVNSLSKNGVAFPVQHNLLKIVVMTICAVITGCDVWEAIADFCRVKENWLHESLNMEFKNGVPSHDTLSRAFSMIKPDEFEKCFCAWVAEVCKKCDGEIASIDGKTMRGNRDKERSPIHMVSAWAHEQRLVLG